MKFLTRFFEVYNSWFRSSSSNIGPLKDTEGLSRFLTSKRSFNREHNVVKPQAFRPPKDLRLSVFRTEGLAAKKVWALARRCVTQMSGREVLGAAELDVVSVRALPPLSVNPDNNPPRHAEIIDWPPDKDARLSLSQKLAKAASLKLKVP